MTFIIKIQTLNGPHNISLVPGETLFFIGANGSGKTRLAVNIETTLKEQCHRISAHRALSLDLSIPKISRKNAENTLFFGHENHGINNRNGLKWNSKAETHLLNDYNALLQVLFAEQNDTALETHNKARSGDKSTPKATRFEILKRIWEELLPERELEITGDTISIKTNTNDAYSAESMSDGERAVFYIIGQVLCAPKNSVIIFDEPELHIHRSILSNLWDKLQVTRPDCAFIMISHDLEFVATRNGQKYILKKYVTPNTWDIELVPKDTGFDEELTTLILGSRRPVLFIEGENNSFDISIYRNIYPEWKIIPCGSCENVIQSVKTFRNAPNLTRIGCAGIIDCDDRTPEEIASFRQSGIYALCVSEIENLILLPEISKAICKLEACDADQTKSRLMELKNEVFDSASQDKNTRETAVRFVLRRLDREFKKANFIQTKDIGTLCERFEEDIKTLSPSEFYNEFICKLQQTISNDNLDEFLSIYDNKSMIASAAKHLSNKPLAEFENWLVRQLGDSGSSDLKKAFKEALPEPKIQ